MTGKARRSSLLVAETLNAFSSQRVAAILTAAAFVVATTLYLQGLGDAAWFLTITYVFLPALLLPIYVARTPAERGAGFALVLYTYPITQRQYYFSRFVSNVLVGLAYMAATLVFALPLAYLTGPYWLALLPTYLLLCLGVVGATSALGLLIGALMGRQRMSVAGFTGFLVAMVAFGGPRMVLYAETISEPAVRLAVLRLLHLLPTVPAAALLPLGGYPVVGSPLLQQAMLPLLTVLYLVVGHHAYCGLQGPEGWKVPRGQVTVFAITAVVLLAAPMLLPLDHGHDEGVLLRKSNDATGVRAELMLSLDPHGKQEVSPTGKIHQGTQYDTMVALSLRGTEPTPATLHNVTVRLESDLLGLHGDTVNLGDVEVPGAADSTLGATTGAGELTIVPVPIPVDVQSATGLVWSEPVVIIAHVTTDEGEYVLSETAHVAPATDAPDRTTPFGLAAAVSGLAWGIVLASRKRK